MGESSEAIDLASGEYDIFNAPVDGGNQLNFTHLPPPIYSFESQPYVQARDPLIDRRITEASDQPGDMLPPHSPVNAEVFFYTSSMFSAFGDITRGTGNLDSFPTESQNPIHPDICSGNVLSPSIL